MAATEPIIGASLTAAELPDAEILVREAGWNQIAADWKLFLDLGTVHAARQGGRVVATAATLPYGEFAWISMVLVAGEHRGHGLGSRLLKRCIEALRDEGRVPLLDATPAGRPLYRGLGFLDTWEYQRLVRDKPSPVAAPAQPGITVRAIRDADWPAICALDAATFGAARPTLLQRLRGRLPPAELLAEHSGRIVGFLLGRNGRSASQLGPLVASTDDIAQALLAHALAALDSRLYLDFADSKTALRTWLAGQGFAAQRPLTRMVLGRSRGFDDEARTFAVAGPELG